jgi:glycosyltransferase involved in cell wall biosynthesis
VVEMKIIHVNDTRLKLGGAETYIYDIINLLKENGHKVEFFAPNNFNSLFSFLGRFYNPFAFFGLLKMIKNFKPDVIHVHSIMRNISPSVLHAAKLKKIPVVMTVHDFHLVCPTTWFSFKDGNPCTHGFGWRCFVNNCPGAKKGIIGLPYNFMRNIKTLLHRKIIKNNVNLFLTSSRIIEGWIKDSLGVEDSFHSPYFIDIKKPRKLSIPKEKIILFVGRISEEKGLVYLINTIPYLKRKIPEIKLLIVGSGPEENKMRAKIKELGIEENVEMVGWVGKKDILDFYRKSGLVAIPSVWTETFGIVAVEAMSQGKPIIVSKSGGLKEIVEEGVNGYSVDIKNPKELTSRIIEIMGDPKKLKRFSEMSFKLSDKYLDKKKHLNKMEQIYKSVIKS